MVMTQTLFVQEVIINSTWFLNFIREIQWLENKFIEEQLGYKWLKIIESQKYKIYLTILIFYRFQFKTLKEKYSFDG